MPNWTYNYITVRGSKEDLNKMMNDAEKTDGVLNLSSWFPIPETFKKYDTTNHPNGEGLRVGEQWYDGLGNHDALVTEELIEEFKQATKEQREKYGVVGWYDYNCKMYGCKWNSEVNVESQTDDEVVLTCDTPWSAPDAWLLRMSDKYPTLNFHNHAEYEEGFWEDSDYEDGCGDVSDRGEMEYDDEDAYDEEEEA